MKKLILVFLLLPGLTVSGQNGYTNHWINFGQEYIKISFQKTGVYRLQYKDIKALNGAVARPGDIRVTQRGREILKTGSGFSDGRFDEGDYYEFFLQANQGEQDSLVYQPHADRPRVIDNLFSDESYIFVSVGPSAGRTYTPSAFKNALITEDFHIAREVTSFKDTWSFNNLIGLIPFVQQSYYERGESWSGPLIYSDGSASEKIFLKNYSPRPGHPVRFHALIYTRSHLNHAISAKINNQVIGNIRHTGFEQFYVSADVPDAELTPDHSFTFSTLSSIKNTAVAHSWTNYTLTYPQTPDMAGKDTLTLNLPASPAASSALSIRNAGGELIAYDISDAASGKRIPFSGDALYIENRPAARRVFLTRETLAFREGSPVTFRLPSVTANYVIITHPSLREAAEEYKAYRTSSAGGGYRTDLVEIQDIYDQFNYGERSPLAIREYLRYQMQNDTTQDRFLLLVGKPVSFPNSLKTDADLDLVPAFGYPGSDALFSTGLGGLHQDVSAFLTGRIAARENQEVKNYLQKVKEFEIQPSAAWKKQVLHLNGGNGATEINSFKGFMEQMGGKAGSSLTNLSVTHLFKQSTDNTEQVNISREANNGLGFISYFGHGSSSTLDFNIGYVSDARLGFSNKGKYPFMYFNGCGVSNIFYHYSPLSTDWLFTPDKGAIAVLANSFWAYSSSSMDFLETLYTKMFDTPALLGKPVGKIIREAISAETRKITYNIYDQSNSHQMILQGDPALIVNPFENPDYTFEEGSLSLRSINSSVPLKDSDRVIVSAGLSNLGRITSQQPVEVSVYLEYDDGTVESSGFQRIDRSFGTTYADTLGFRSGLRRIRLIIDEGGKISEITRENNTAHLDINWEDARNNAIYPYSRSKDEINPVLLAYINDALPLASARVYRSAPLIRFLLKDENLLTRTSAGIRALLKGPGDAGFTALSGLPLNSVDNNTVEGFFQSPATPGNYELLLNGSDAAGNLTGQDIHLAWIISEDAGQTLTVSPNPSRNFVKFTIKNPGADQAVISLTSLLGKTVHQGEYPLKDGPNEVFLPLKPPAGTYLYTVLIGEQRFTGRLILTD